MVLLVRQVRDLVGPPGQGPAQQRPARSVARQPVGSPSGEAVSSLVIDADTRWLEEFKRDNGSLHLLAMSRGKDALASWLVLREHGIDVVPYHLYLVPELEFVQESLYEIEKFFGVKVIQRPHRSLIRMLDNLVYQPPERIEVINAWDPKVPTYIEIDSDVRRISGAPDTAISALGTKACDSMNRRTTFVRYGHVRKDKEGRRTFFPVWN